MNIWDVTKSIFFAIAFLFLFHYVYNYWNNVQNEKHNHIENVKNEKYKIVIQEIENKLRELKEKEVPPLEPLPPSVADSIQTESLVYDTTYDTPYDTTYNANIENHG